MGTGKRPRVVQHRRAGGGVSAGTERRPPRQRELRGVVPARRVRNPDALLEAVHAALQDTAVGAALPDGVSPVRALARAYLGDDDLPQLRAALRQTALARHGRSAFAMRLDEVLALDGLQGRKMRRRAGSYYTPSLLVDAVLSDGLDPLLASVHELSALAALRIVDPAAGSGAFVVPAARRIVARARELGASAEAAHRIGAIVLVAADLDDLALLALRRRCLAEGLAEPRCLVGNALTGDAFTNPTVSAARVAACGAIEWRSAVPDVAARGGFDLVLGNPPFANAMEGGLACVDAMSRATHYQQLPSTADLATVFVARALQLVRAQGRVSLVLPRSLLVVEGAQAVRERALATHHLECVRLPESARHFHGADVHVVLLTLGPKPTTRVETGFGTEDSRWHEGVVSTGSWWEDLDAILHPVVVATADAITLDQYFEVRSNFFVQDFYALKPFVVDDERGCGPRLVTTGLIEPQQVLWGTAVCRYGGRDYLHPRLDIRAMPDALQRKVEQQRGAKILVAGLARRMEAVLDRIGDLVGAVQTFRLTPRRGGVRAMSLLTRYLNSPEATAWLRRRLGGNALSGGNISLRAEFLRTLPLPRELVQKL